jgi:hypothetical protein
MGVMVVITIVTSLAPVTLVYNMRVRRSFNVPESLKQLKSRYLVTALPIYFQRDSQIDNQGDVIIAEDRKTGGVIGNLRYIPSKRWWAEVSTGVEKDSGSFTGASPFSASRVGLDDVVFTSGYRHFVGKHAQVIGYGLVGLPTRRTVTLEDRFGPLVGTRVYNAGVGGEASYSFANSLKRSTSFIVQGRFIHGFDRRWDPILPADEKIVPGNFSDVLVAFQYREKRTLFQAGYDMTIFNNQGIKRPNETVTIDTFIRNSWYATLAHGTLHGFVDKPTFFGAGFSVSRTQRFTARTLTAWIFLTQLL